MSALSRLEGIGVPIETILNDNIIPIQENLSTFVKNAHTYTNSISLLGAWLTSDVPNCRPPTWRNLFEIIQLDDDLAQQVHQRGAIREEDQLSIDSGISEPDSKIKKESESKG